MINVRTLTDLYRHMEWADATVWKAVLSCDAAAKDDKLRRSFAHLHMVQRAFLLAWRGEPRDKLRQDFADAPTLMRWAREYYPEGFGHVSSWSDEEVSKAMPHPWIEMVKKRLGKTPQETTLGDTALQVVLHSQYHRGQVNARLREVGGEPPLVDYIAWVWLGRPAAEWPSAEA